MNNLEKTKVAVYCLVSPNNTDKCCNISIQKDLANIYIHYHNYELIGYYCDDVASGKTPMEDRQEGARLLQDAANKLFDIVLIFNIYCLGTRSAIISNAIQSIKDNGANVRAISQKLNTNTSQSELMSCILHDLAVMVAKRKEHEHVPYNSGNVRSATEPLFVNTPLARFFIDMFCSFAELEEKELIRNNQ